MSDSKTINQDALDKFQATLNRHGYGFQFAVLSESQKCFDSRTSAFVLETIELPVVVNGNSSRIDFVLKRVSEHLIFPFPLRPLYLVAECKRANPSLSTWCFARAPFTRQNGHANHLFIESVQIDHKGKISTAQLLL